MDLVPRKLDIYIVRKFISTFFIALLLIIGIVIIFDISEKIDDFVSKEAPLKAIIFDYYVNFVPYFMNMFSPMFVFITVIFFTSKMAADSEIVAILSCGISFHRMMVPYVFSATLIAILSLCLNLFVIPDANKTRLEFENKYFKGQVQERGAQCALSDCAGRIRLRGVIQFMEQYRLQIHTGKDRGRQADFQDFSGDGSL